MKFRDCVGWVTAVGDDPKTGGGVARAVNLIDQSGLIKANNGNLISLHGFSKYRQIVLCMKMLLVGYRKFVLHSFFSPFSLFLLCLPVPVKVVIFPHGELKCGALAINAKRKRLFLWLMQRCYKTNHSLKVVGAVATTDEELQLLREILPVAYARKSPDFVSMDLLLAEPKSVDPTRCVNLVNIARMVPSKGVASFLKVLAEKLASRAAGWTRAISGVYLFYTEEDASELAAVTRLSEQVRAMGVPVYLFAGLSPDQIRKTLCDVPNRLGFLCSRFESFSYALIESLGFEYRPIVWFQNDLVEELSVENLCQRWVYGSLDAPDNRSPLQPTAIDQVQAFITRAAKKNAAAYQHVLSQTFGDAEVAAPVHWGKT